MTTASLRARRGSVAGRALLVAALLAGLAPVAHAADITVRNAWMRPAAAGAESARVYVDIRSDVAVELVGASSPQARKVEIVRTETIGDPASEKVVATYPIAADVETRLAYRGDHLRLLGVLRDAHNGEPVPLTLRFRDAAGKRTDLPLSVTVRGLLAPTAPVPQAAEGAGAGTRSPSTR